MARTAAGGTGCASRSVPAGTGNGRPARVALPSASATSMANPPRPSARAWCSTRTSAARSAGRPVTTQARQRGRCRSRGVHTRSARTSSSSASLVAVRLDRCRCTSNEASSAHTGRPHPTGVSRSRWRSRGTAVTRRSSRCRTVETSSVLAPSSTSAAPMFIGTWPRSVTRVVRSFTLTRSTSPDGAGVEHWLNSSRPTRRPVCPDPALPFPLDGGRLRRRRRRRPAHPRRRSAIPAWRRCSPAGLRTGRGRAAPGQRPCRPRSCLRRRGGSGRPNRPCRQ